MKRTIRTKKATFFKIVKSQPNNGIIICGYSCCLNTGEMEEAIKVSGNNRKTPGPRQLYWHRRTMPIYRFEYRQRPKNYIGQQKRRSTASTKNFTGKRKKVTSPSAEGVEGVYYRQFVVDKVFSSRLQKSVLNQELFHVIPALKIPIAKAALYIETG